jgi:cytochrome c oxidase assembly factor CtaG
MTIWPSWPPPRYPRVATEADVDPIVAAALASWTCPPWIAVALLLALALYARGWRQLRRQMPQRFGDWRLVAFVAGLATLFVAIASPLDAFSGLLLQVHMTQHLLLMMVAPPLIWLGAPAAPLLRGLPSSVLKNGLGPFLAWPALQRFGRRLTHPLVCWVSFVVTTWLWHVPALYELALRSPAWHQLEHVCFLLSALLFWWPVIQPWPSTPIWPRWAMIPYLLLADIQNTMFSALFAFSERILYPAYAAVPRLWDISVLNDQAAAGAIMWVPGSVAFLIPLGWVIVEWLGAPSAARAPTNAATIALGAGGTTRQRWDLLTARIVGPLLSWRYFRRAAQMALLLLATAVVVDGLLGPQMSPMNLAGVLAWTYWRGLSVIALLAAGNVFCMACPFMLPRDLGRRWLPARRRWPRALRSKWLAVALLLLYLWAYEAFSLWDSPRWTAWIIIGYFAAAFTVDGFFRGASFCKYICPIGQFHFVQSLVSPLEVRVRDTDVCTHCTTYDCIRGNAQHRGCELQLFQPKKVGNLDCTFCLDCVHACPHANVGILATVPGSDLTRDPYRSSVRRMSRRPDVAALALVLVFGAFANAGGMAEPVMRWQQSITGRSALPVAGGLLLCVVIVPALAVGLCGWIGRRLSGAAVPARQLVCRFALSLVPLGLSMWVAHFIFHLTAGVRTAVPVVQRVFADVGSTLLGAPDWAPSASAPAQDWILPLQLVLLGTGLLLTLYVDWRIASSYVRRAGRALGLMMPWASLAIALYVAGVWIVSQPMQMRGMMMP